MPNFYQVPNPNPVIQIEQQEKPSDFVLEQEKKRKENQEIDKRLNMLEQKSESIQSQQKGDAILDELKRRNEKLNLDYEYLHISEHYRSCVKLLPVTTLNVSLAILSSSLAGITRILILLFDEPISLVIFESARFFS